MQSDTEPQPGSDQSRGSTSLPSIPDHELMRRIGRGSYGEVWLARHSRLGTLRAVKIVRRDQFDDARPFQREFDGIRRYEPISRGHLNLVAILHVGGTDDCFFYLMELADAREMSGVKSQISDRESAPIGLLTSDTGRSDTYTADTLRSELKRRGALPLDRCLEIGLALASALAHLHERGLVHRDVKPSNVILVGGVPKLADIGLVAAVSDSRSFVGTEGYIPPEGPGTPSADCYALGKLLYELSTGHDRTAFSRTTRGPAHATRPRAPARTQRRPPQSLRRRCAAALSICRTDARGARALAAWAIGQTQTCQAIPSEHRINTCRGRSVFGNGLGGHPLENEFSRAFIPRGGTTMVPGRTRFVQPQCGLCSKSCSLL